MTWKRIVIEGQETHYEVSHRGSVYNTESEKMLHQTNNSNGYLKVSLRLPDGTERSFLVHRLVALAFIPNDVPERNQVNHINGDKEDNRVSNLEWVTDQENKIHGVRTGLYKVGEDHGRAVYKDEDIHKVCRLLSKGYKPKEIAGMTNVSLEMINHIKNGDNWLHISCNYDFERTKPRVMFKEYYKLIDGIILTYGITKPSKIREHVLEETQELDDATFRNLVNNRIRKLRQQNKI